MFWSGIVGHTQVVEQLRRIIARKTVPHALVFTGPEGIGKRTVARAFAAALLTADGADSKTEEKLRLLAGGNHPDFHMCIRPEDKKDISVESIRELCSAIRLKPYYATATVSVIDNAHEMSIAAGNALLMTLEEPCDESYLILVTHAPQRLPATILSRCQSISFGELTASELSTLVDRIPGLSPKTCEEAVGLCSGSLEALELNQFVHPLSLVYTDEKRIRLHLEELVQDAARLRNEIDTFISQAIDQTTSAAAAASLASQLAAEADESPFVWKIFHRCLRDSLRSAKRSDIERLANLLELSLTAEKLVRERNVNSQLQLTSLLLQELQ